MAAATSGKTTRRVCNVRHGVKRPSPMFWLQPWSKLLAASDPHVTAEIYPSLILRPSQPDLAELPLSPWTRCSLKAREKCQRLGAIRSAHLPGWPQTGAHGRPLGPAEDRTTHIRQQLHTCHIRRFAVWHSRNWRRYRRRDAACPAVGPAVHGYCSSRNTRGPFPAGAAAESFGLLRKSRSATIFPSADR